MHLFLGMTSYQPFKDLLIKSNSAVQLSEILTDTKQVVFILQQKPIFGNFETKKSILFKNTPNTTLPKALSAFKTNNSAAADVPVSSIFNGFFSVIKLILQHKTN